MKSDINSSHLSNDFTSKRFNSRIILGNRVGHCPVKEERLPTDFMIPKKETKKIVPSKDSQEGKELSYLKPCNLSPFSDVFFSSSKTSLSLDKPMISKISFEGAFFQLEQQIEPSLHFESYKSENKTPRPCLDSPLTNTSWTKTRIRARESKISSIQTNTTREISNKSISLTKEMISNATFIAQLATKFIIINAGGVLCVVDQVSFFQTFFFRM